MRLLLSRINRSRTGLALLLVWLLAGVQISGLHLHLLEDGGIHVHALYDPGHGHGHSHASDHNLLEEVEHSPPSLLVKLLLVLPLALIVLLLSWAVGGGRSPRPGADFRLPDRARFHLAPPLRAPPLSP